MICQKPLVDITVEYKCEPRHQEFPSRVTPNRAPSIDTSIRENAAARNYYTNGHTKN